jgi:hypothetical protein
MWAPNIDLEGKRVWHMGHVRCSKLEVFGVLDFLMGGVDGSEREWGVTVMFLEGSDRR